MSLLLACCVVRTASTRAAAAATAAAEKTKITVEALLRELDETRKRAMETHQFSAAIAAIREMGVLSGKHIERREIGAPGEFESMTDNELESALREHLVRLGFLDRNDTQH